MCLYLNGCYIFPQWMHFCSLGPQDKYVNETRVRNSAFLKQQPSFPTVKWKVLLYLVPFLRFIKNLQFTHTQKLWPLYTTFSGFLNNNYFTQYFIIKLFKHAAKLKKISSELNYSLLFTVNNLHPFCPSPRFNIIYYVTYPFL